MRSGDETPEEKRVFDRLGEDTLGCLAVERVKAEAASKNLYREYGTYAPSILWTWSHWGDPSEISVYLSQTFERDSGNVIEFLKTFLSTSWELGTGISRNGDFERHQFNRVTTLIDPQLVYDHLLGIYGTDLENAGTSRWDYMQYPLDKKVAFQFAALHKHVKDEATRSRQGNLRDAETSGGSRDEDT